MQDLFLLEVFGLQRIGERLAEHILKKLQLSDFDVIVCSSAWSNYIQSVLEKDKHSINPEVLLEKTRLHIESFES